MSMVPASGTSVELPVLAPVPLMLTSIDRARPNRATPGSRTGHHAPTPPENCAAEPDPRGGTYFRLVRGRKSRMGGGLLAGSDGRPTDPAQPRPIRCTIARSPWQPVLVGRRGRLLGQKRVP